MRYGLRLNNALVAVFLILILTAFPHQLKAEKKTGIVGKGEAVVVGITPEEGQLIALQRARADAIEKAVGVNILGSTLVTDGRLAGQFLKAFSRGFITDENCTLELDKQGLTPRYVAKIIATVLVPEKEVAQDFQISSSLKKSVFIQGEEAVLKIRSSKPAYIGVFNLRADDRVVMLYPNKYCNTSTALAPNIDWVFPQEKSGISLAVEPLPGHKRDSEAFFVVALQADKTGPYTLTTLFKEDREYTVPEFFELYGGISEHSVEQILPYEVVRRVSE